MFSLSFVSLESVESRPDGISLLGTEGNGEGDTAGLLGGNVLWVGTVGKEEVGGVGKELGLLAEGNGVEEGTDGNGVEAGTDGNGVGVGGKEVLLGASGKEEFEGGTDGNEGVEVGVAGKGVEGNDGVEVGADGKGVEGKDGVVGAEGNGVEGKDGVVVGADGKEGVVVGAEGKEGFEVGAVGNEGVEVGAKGNEGVVDGTEGKGEEGTEGNAFGVPGKVELLVTGGRGNEEFVEAVGGGVGKADDNCGLYDGSCG